MINKKFLEVMAACQYIQKKGINASQGNYTYVMAADVLEKVNAALIKQGLISLVTPEIIESWEIVTGKGNKMNCRTVKVTVTLMDSETGENLSFTGIGSGMDTGDKAVMKAQTAALKYAWMQSLCIATGDDPEADETVDQETAAPVLQDVWIVEKTVQSPAGDRAQVTMTHSRTGETVVAVIKKHYNEFKGNLRKNAKIQCQFGTYTSPNGKNFREILSPRLVA